MDSTGVPEPPYDLSDSCRICMIKSVKMSNLFDENDQKLIENIEFCTGILLKNEDGLSKHLCKSCLRSLSVAYKFKTLCLMSEKMCQKLLQSIKLEQAEVADCGNVENQATDFENEYNEAAVCGNVDNESSACGNVCNESFDNGDGDNNAAENNISKVDSLNVQIGVNSTMHMQEMNLNCDYVKAEDIRLTLVKGSGARNRQRLVKRRKVEESNVKVKKRGPYKRGPPRMRKYKFTKLACEPCGLKFPTKLESDQHKQSMHKDVSYMCEVCGKTFIHRGSHYTHVKSHLPPNHACDHCDYRTTNKYDLQKHLRIHLGIKQFSCASCPASYHTSSNLRDHERRSHQRLRRFACAVCQRRFYDRTKLDRHVDSHNDVKRFECEVCHTAFTRRCYWKKHLERQHSVLVPAQRPGRQKNRLVIGESASAWGTISSEPQ